MSFSSTTPMAIAASAALLVSIAQTDWFSRSIACSPEQLQRKRILSYQYQWNQALIQQIRTFHSSSAPAEIITTQVEIQEFVQRLVNSQLQHSNKGKSQENVTSEFHQLRIIHIGRDSELMPSSVTSGNPIDTYFVWLRYSETNNSVPSRSVQIPLLKFGHAYREALDQGMLLRKFTLCFIYDATPQLTSSLLVPLLSKVTKLFPNTAEHTHSPEPMAQHPAWMVQLALLLASPDTSVASHAALQQCLYAFLCLEAFFRTESSISQNTVIYTIPTSIIPIVLPVLHDLFPDDRHVFCYTGCMQALSLTLPSPVVEEPASFSSNVAWTSPVYMQNHEDASPLFASSSLGGGHVRKEALYRAMTRVPVALASHVECWMAALDTLLVRQKQKGISFLPYVCKIDYLLPALANFSTNANPINAVSAEVNLRWSVRSLLQYVTGTRSREMAPETLDAACRWLDVQTPPLNTPVAWQRVIEEIVFQHKLILLPNKTLVDTVQPTEHWTLKQSAKMGGCACCGPNEDDEEEEEDAVAARTEEPWMGMPLPVKARGFVDGKTTFAFDPSQFA